MSDTLASLVISDGAVGGLVALSAHFALPDRDRSPIGVVAWGFEPEEADARARAVAEQARAMGATIVDVTAARPADGETVGNRVTRRLVEVALAARAMGVRRVVWPAHAGADHADGGGGGVLDRVAAIIDRAALVSRLVSLDDERAGNVGVEARDAGEVVGVGSGGGVEITTPYADLSDREMAELMLDLDAPVWTCWWARGGGAKAALEREHWREVLRELGWSAPLPRAPAGV
ncbi:MAG: hypothetical protein JNM80_05965 [Phycisphaerae bacterium]|nr:hypothetical protein [Phycisphaerae bacterium]